MSRVSAAHLMALGSSLSDRDREVIAFVSRFEVASARQIESVFFSEPDLRSGSRLARRTLSHLSEEGLLSRLERRIGGVRAGSAGYVYRVGHLGSRLVSYWSGRGLPRGRKPHEPGRMFVRHRLAICETFVQLHQADRDGRLEILDFDCEPACWRETTGMMGAPVLLKPDAFLRVGLGAYEDRYFLEIDLGTEGRSTLRRKAQAYLDYYRSGREQADTGVFPRVLWITTNQERCQVITNACASLPAEAWQLFGVTTPARSVDLIAAGVTQAVDGGAL